MKTLLPLSLLALCASLQPLTAQNTLPGTDVVETTVEKQKISFSQEMSIEEGYVGDARTRTGTIRLGDVSEQSSHFNYVLLPQINKEVVLRLGVDWERYSFGLPNGTPLPNTLQSTALVVGSDIMLNDQWVLRVEAKPGVYSDFEDVSSRDINAPLALAAVYLVDERLQWIFGLSLDVFRNVPVIPVAGVRWKFDDDWTLMAILPHPQLQYELNKNVDLFLGGDLKGGSYRIGENFGTPLGRTFLNNTQVDYTEVRAGLGSEWKVSPWLTLQIEGGGMIYREFEYHPSKLKIKSDPAPYGEVSASAKF